MPSLYRVVSVVSGAVVWISMVGVVVTLVVGLDCFDLVFAGEGLTCW